jgi:hypothetical protein
VSCGGVQTQAPAFRHGVFDVNSDAFQTHNE